MARGGFTVAVFGDLLGIIRRVRRFISCSAFRAPHFLLLCGGLGGAGVVAGLVVYGLWLEWVGCRVSRVAGDGAGRGFVGGDGAFVDGGVCPGDAGAGGVAVVWAKVAGVLGAGDRRGFGGLPLWLRQAADRDGIAGRVCTVEDLVGADQHSTGCGAGAVVGFGDPPSVRGRDSQSAEWIEVR